MTAERIPVLLYHSVAPSCDPRFAEWTVTPEQFAAQMSHLDDKGYRPLTIRELATQAFERRAPIDPRSVVITFDDGFADFHQHAWPQLRRHSLTATVFISTGYVGGTSAWLAEDGEGDRQMLSWAQIMELHAEGVECAAHGHRHLQLDTVSAAVARSDIEQSKSALERVIGPVASFAYPHGYYTKRLQRQVAEAGFRSACAVRDALSSTEDDRFAIARIVVRGGTGLDAFARLLEGDGVEVAPRDATLRRGAWRALRRAGAEPIVHRLRSREAPKRAEGVR
jgi:peptidoglycan/xylan/chitin deacetylase (PgdA/CDA1 family)